MRSSCMRTTWPTQRNCACSKKASMPVMPHKCKTSVLGTRSCHLMPAILRRHIMWNSSSLRTERLFTHTHTHRVVDDLTETRRRRLVARTDAETNYSEHASITYVHATVLYTEGLLPGNMCALQIASSSMSSILTSQKQQINIIA